MTVLASCFRCGKAVLVREEAQLGTPYCSTCRNSLGLPDPQEAAPAPDPIAQKPKEEKPVVRTAAVVKKPRRAVRAAERADEDDERDRRIRRPAEREDEDDYRDSPGRQRSSEELGGGARVGLIVGTSVGGIVLVTVVVLVAVLAAKKEKRTSTASRSNDRPVPGGPVQPAPVINPAPDPARVGPPLQRNGGQVVLRRSIQASTTGVWGVSFSPDGNTVATASGYLGAAGQLRFWEADGGQPLQPVLAPGSDLFGVAFRPGGDLVATAGATGVHLYDRQGRTQGSFRHPSYVRSVAFSPAGDRLASNCERQLTVWDVSTGRALWTANLLGELVAWRIPTRLCFAPDGRTVACGNGSSDVVLYDADTGQPRLTCRGHRGLVLCTAYTPDGRYLVSGGLDHTLKVWDPSTGRELRTLQGHTDWVFCAAFARDGRTLASAGREGGVILWDVVSGRKLAALTAHRKEAGGVAFSPRSNLLASSGIDGMVHLWDVSQVVAR